MRTSIILIIIFTIVPVLLKSQEIFTLKQCIDTGLEKNYQIRIVRNNQKISDNNLSLGNAGYLPTLDLSAGYSGTLNNVTQYPETGDNLKDKNVHNQLLNAGINLNWTVFEGFSIQTNNSRLKELQKIGELNTRLGVEDLISTLTSEYYNYIQQTIRLKNLKSAVDLSRERLRIVEERYNIGVSSRLDYQQARVDFNSDSSKLIQQREVVFSARIRFNQILAMDSIETELNVEDTIILFDILMNKEELLQKAISGNIYLLLAQKEKDISVLDLKTVQAQNYPYLRLNAGYGYNQNMYGTGTYKQQNNLGFNYGVTLGYNIFDGFNRSRSKENARIVIDSKELAYQELELSVKSDFADVWMAYLNNMKLKNLEKENIETARDNYEIAMDRYKLGDLSGIELREAQNSLLEAEERLIQAQYKTKLCEISIMQICGQLDIYLK
ncbi:MAG: TolC family protein [Bacteroidales bacterium]|jgi:outer membrane protein TolC|nr:TolC family protein [Bacteroidales bacterium]